MPDEKLIDAMSRAQDDIVLEIVGEKLGKGVAAAEVLEDLTAGMKRLGQRFADGDAFIPEVVFGAEAFNQAMEILKPKLGEAAGEIMGKGKIVMATVKGDIHDIGKGLVAIFLQLAGYEIIDLGHDVPNEKIIEAIEKDHPVAVGLSSLMTTTMLSQKAFIEALQAKDLRDEVKVIVGGAPITQAWADEIEADAFGADALDGRRKIDQVLGN
jgi:corrinoid protein of di/trimethylamine methyltransferase